MKNTFFLGIGNVQLLESIVRWFFLSILENFFSKLSYFWWEVHFCYQNRSGSDHPAASSNSLFCYEIFQERLISRQLRIRSHMWGAPANNRSYSRKKQEIFFGASPFLRRRVPEGVRMISCIFFMVPDIIFWPNVKIRFHLLKKCPNVLLGRNFW